MKLKQALEWKEKLIPAEGFNVVAVDDMGAWDEQGPYLVSHFSVRGEAESARQKHAATTGEACYVYAAK